MSTAFKTAKIAVAAPSPMAMVSITAVVNAGARRRDRQARGNRRIQTSLYSRRT